MNLEEEGRNYGVVRCFIQMILGIQKTCNKSNELKFQIHYEGKVVKLFFWWEISRMKKNVFPVFPSSFPLLLYSLLSGRKTKLKQYIFPGFENELWIAFLCAEPNKWFTNWLCFIGIVIALNKSFCLYRCFPNSCWYLGSISRLKKNNEKKTKQLCVIRIKNVF